MLNLGLTMPHGQKRDKQGKSLMILLQQSRPKLVWATGSLHYTKPDG